jgi:hypothetical protein
MQCRYAGCEPATMFYSNTEIEWAQVLSLLKIPRTQLVAVDEVKCAKCSTTACKLYVV